MKEYSWNRWDFSRRRNVWLCDVSVTHAALQSWTWIGFIYGLGWIGFDWIGLGQKSSLTNF